MSANTIDLINLLELPSDDFLLHAYWEIIGREPDVGGLLHYIGRLQKGLPRELVLAEMRNSPEGRARAPVAKSAKLDALHARYLKLRDLPLGSLRWKWLQRLSRCRHADARFDWADWINAFACGQKVSDVGLVLKDPPTFGDQQAVRQKTQNILNERSSHILDEKRQSLVVIDKNAHDLKTKCSDVKEGSDKIVILFISHDASLTGAPSVLLETARILARTGEYESYFLIGGTHTNRIPDFEACGPCLHATQEGGIKELDVRSLLNHQEPDVIYCNTVVSANLLQQIIKFFDKENINIIAHIHEKRGVLRQFMAEAAYLLENANFVIAVSKEVERDIRELGGKRVQIKIIPPFIKPFDRKGRLLSTGESEITRIFGCGTIEQRKGFDLFCEAIGKLRDCRVKFSAIWIGPSSNDEEPDKSISRFNVSDLVQAVGAHESPRSLYKAGDIFFMPSREDPFPLVCLEAAECGLAIVCFDEHAGGMASFVRASSSGLVCRYLDVEDAVHCLGLLLENKEMRYNMGNSGATYVKRHFYPENVVPEIIPIIRKDFDVTDRIVVERAKLRVLVVSFGPAPIFGIKNVEGGGLRSWGLAKAILSGGIYDVTFDFPNWYVKESNNISESVMGVRVSTWGNIEELLSHVQKVDVIVVSYCYGAYSDAIAEAVTPKQMLIFDCYVPIFVEVSARRSSDRIGEFNAYTRDSRSWNANLARGDILLCANEAQKCFYLGCLFSSGALNPINYESAERLIIAPFGLDADGFVDAGDQVNLISGGNEVKLLWFGGIYPWFDIETLISAVAVLREKVLCSLTIVGARNPFNSHPDFLSVCERIESLIVSEKFSDFIFLEEWCPYEKRFDWYRSADFLVTLNQPGIENYFSWRTRVVDYLASQTRFLTNGGDPLSEELIQIGLGSRIDTSSVSELADSIFNAITQSGLGQVDRQLIEEMQYNLSWDIIGQRIRDAISSWGDFHGMQV